MIIHDITYKWINLSSSVADDTRIVITESDKSIKLRTSYYDRQNYHGANSSLTLASWRLFSFEWIIFWTTKEDRYIWQDVLNNIICPESNPSEDNKWFYPLTWIDDWWNEVMCMAKVISVPEYEHEVGSDIIEFKFELYCEEAYYTSIDDEVEDWAYWFIWWNILPSKLSNTLNWYINDIVVTNEGNFQTPCKIEINGTVVNPRIHNLTTWKFYWVDTTISNFVLDNTDINTIVTDWGVDVSWYRADWSSLIFLEKWDNHLILLWDNYTYPETSLFLVTPINAWIDDWYYNSNAWWSWNNAWPSFYVWKWASWNILIWWLRFNNITLPKWTEIINAHLILYSAWTNWGLTQIIINGVATDNFWWFDATINSPISVSKTLNSLNYSIDATPNYTLNTISDLKNIIQEVLDRPGWNSWNSIWLILDWSINANGISKLFCTVENSLWIYPPTLNIIYKTNTNNIVTVTYKDAFISS